MKKTVEEYLALGCDQRTAEYFASGSKRITSVAPGEDFTLILTFNNGETRMRDMKPLIEQGTVFEFLVDPANFARVYLDDCRSVCWDIDPNVDSEVVWENKVDLCPDCCYMDSVPIE